MPSPRPAIHKCNKEAEINNLTSKVDSLDKAVNGYNGDEGIKVQVARLVTLVTPMVGDVKLATEFILASKEREKLMSEGSSKKSRDTNTWLNLIIAVVALSALAVSIMALKGVPIPIPIP